MRFYTGWLLAIVCVFLLAPGVALGQQTEPPTGKTAESSKEKKTKKKRKVPRNMPSVQALEGVEVIGRIQKPEVFYILGKTDFSYRGLKLKKSFVEKIGRSVRRNPF